MNEEQFDSSLKNVLPYFAKDEKGRWFCVSEKGRDVRFEFFETEQAAKERAAEIRSLRKQSN